MFEIDELKFVGMSLDEVECGVIIVCTRSVAVFELHMFMRRSIGGNYFLGTAEWMMCNHESSLKQSSNHSFI